MKRLFKILIIITTSLSALFIATIIGFTIFIKSDILKNELTKYVNQHIQGKIEFGQFHFALLNGLSAKAESIIIKDLKNDDVLKAKDLSIRTSIFSIFKGPLHLRIEFNDPFLSVSRTTKGEYNVMHLIKKSDQDNNTEKSTQTYFRKRLEDALFDVVLSGATIQIKRDESGPKTVIAPIDLTFKNISLNNTGNNTGEFKIHTPEIPEYRIGNAVTSGTVKPVWQNRQYAGTFLNAKSTVSGDIQAEVNSEFTLLKDKIDNILLQGKVSDVPFRISGSLVSFEKPVIRLNLNLDKIVFGKNKTKSKNDANEKADIDAMVASFSKNKTISIMDLFVQYHVDQIDFENANFSNINGTFSMKKSFAEFHLDSAQYKGSEIKGTLTGDLNQKKPIYRFDFSAKHLDISTFKAGLSGKASMSAKGTFPSLNQSEILSHSSGQGRMTLEDAGFQTINISKATTDGINAAFFQLGSQIPGLYGKKVPEVASRGLEYQSITSDFHLGNGSVTFPNFVAKAKPNLGFDVTGKATVLLLNKNVSASLDVSDTYNLTRAKDLTKGILSQSGIIHIPIEVGCNLYSPCISYPNVARALQQNLQKQVLDTVISNFPSDAKAAIKKLFEKSTK